MINCQFLLPFESDFRAKLPHPAKSNLRVNCEFTYFLKKITSVRLLKIFSNLYAYSFWKILCTVITEFTFIRDVRVLSHLAISSYFNGSQLMP